MKNYIDAVSILLVNGLLSDGNMLNAEHCVRLCQVEIVQHLFFQNQWLSRKKGIINFAVITSFVVNILKQLLSIHVMLVRKISTTVIYIFGHYIFSVFLTNVYPRFQTQGYHISMENLIIFDVEAEKTSLRIERKIVVSRSSFQRRAAPAWEILDRKGYIAGIPWVTCII